MQRIAAAKYVLGGLGGLILTYLSVLWVFGFGPIGDRPLLLFGMLLALFGSQLVGVGLLGELILSRTINERDKYALRQDRIVKK